MDQEGIKSVHIRRRQRSLTDSRKARDDRYKNRTMDLEINRLFQVVSSDISYARTGEGFDYLCKVRDVYTGVVLASCQENTMKKELVLKTIKQAQKRWHLPEGTIWHSDRGSQYTAEAVKRWPKNMIGSRVFPRQANLEIMHGVRVYSQY